MDDRECGTCTLCCKLVGVPEIGLPAGQWCQHCNVGVGCKIYDDRPTPCRIFRCLYLQSEIGEHWRPTRAKIVVAPEPFNNRLAIYVDKGAEGKWRDEPYYSDVKRLAHSCAAKQEILVVREGKNHTVIFPDKEQSIGALDEDQFIVVQQRGPEFHAFIVEKDDPRATAMAKQNEKTFGHLGDEASE